MWAGSRYYGAGKNQIVEDELPVLVAARDLRAGELLSQDAVRVQAYPARAISADMAGPEDRASIVDLNLRIEVNEGSPILRSYVSGSPVDRRLSARLGGNERAITIAIDPVSGLAGHLQPNDRVDVLGTFQVPAVDAGGGVRTKTLLVNVPVMAVGSETGTSLRGAGLSAVSLLAGRRRAGSAATTATLRVSPEQAEVLALANETAALCLVLRNADAAEEGGVGAGLTLREALNLPPVRVSERPPTTPAPPVTYER